MTADQLARTVFWLHASATLVMVGIIWTVQIVHYPLMAMADRRRYADFQSQHERRISRVVIPVMLTELLTACLLAVAPWSAVAAPLAWAGLGLLALIWGSTFLIQVPLHGKLGHGFDAAAHRRLVRSNWIRTAAWTARGLLVSASVFAVH
jgi:hypothetical protein